MITFLLRGTYYKRRSMHYSQDGENVSYKAGEGS